MTTGQPLILLRFMIKKVSNLLCPPKCQCHLTFLLNSYHPAHGRSSSIAAQQSQNARPRVCELVVEEVESHLVHLRRLISIRPSYGSPLLPFLFHPLHARNLRYCLFSICLQLAFLNLRRLFLFVCLFFFQLWFWQGFLLLVDVADGFFMFPPQLRLSLSSISCSFGEFTLQSFEKVRVSISSL